MKRSNFTFLFLFALLSFVSNQAFSQTCVGDANASVDGATCTVDLSGLTRSTMPVKELVIGGLAGHAVAATNSGMISFGTSSAFTPFVGTTQTVEVIFTDGSTCWGNVTFETKDIPPSSSGSIIDTICCGEDLPWADYSYTVPAGTCYAELDTNTIQTTYSQSSGGICDTIIHVETITGIVIGGDNNNKNGITLRTDTIYEIPLDFNAVLFPPGEITIECDEDGDYDFSPNAIAEQKGDNGIMYAMPHMVKDSTVKITPKRDTIELRDTLENQKVLVGDQWVLLDVIDKRDTIIITMDTTKTPNVIALKDNDENQQTTCNINVKCVDMELTGECGLPVVMRMWTVLDWCDAKNSVKDSVQWIKVQDSTPSIELDGDKTPGIRPWYCDGSTDITVDADGSCADLQMVWSTTEGTVTGTGMTRTVTGLWADQAATVTVIATNKCTGVADTAEIVITAEDNVPPVAVAEDAVTVSLTPDGNAKVPGYAIDAGSNDQGCGDVTYCVYREDGDKDDCGDAITVTCADLGTPVAVVLVVEDATGNTAESWAWVNVEDKTSGSNEGGELDALCAAPSQADLVDVVSAASSACGDDPVIVVDTPKGPDACGQGREVLSYTVDGVYSTDSVVVNYEGSAEEFDGEIEWPEDDTFSCSVGEFETEPTYTSPVCNLVAWSVDQSDFIWDDESCGKIIRDYTVIDWCTFDESGKTVAEAGESDGVYRHSQVLKILDDTAPVFDDSFEAEFTVTGGKEFKGDDAECSAAGVISVTATDLCGELSTGGVQYTWSFEGETGTGNTLDTDDLEDVELEVGEEYSITFTASDKCGNATEFEYEFTVTDTKNPTPICRPGINTATMNVDGSCVAIWAADYDLGSYDNCGDVTVLFEVTDEDGETSNESSVEICCSDIAANGATQELKLVVTDDSGNSDFCTVYLTVQDNAGICGIDNGAAAIAGEVRTELGDMIESAEVSLNAINTDMTSVDGKYAFGNNPMYASYEVTSKKNDDYLNGVTTLDLVLIQKHVLGIEALDSPYKVIAADINGDQGVSAIDLVELRKLILGVYNELPSNDSWRFVDATETFADANDPFPFTEALRIGDLNSPALNQDFLGVKIGDVSGNAIANSLIAAGTRSAGTLSLEIADAAVAAGEEVSVAVTAANFSDIAAYQFTMNVNGLELSGVESGAINVSAENFGLIDNNTITTAWNSTAGVSTTDVLFTMNFTATAATTLSNAISISSSVTSAAAYTANADQLDVQVSFNGVAANEFALFQNQPNPFDNVTNIAFELPTAASATLTVFDVTGKTVSIVKGDFAKGSNTITLDKSDLNTSGVLYYQLESGSFTATKKMIVLE